MKIARQSSLTQAGQDVAVVVRRLAVTNALGLEQQAYDDAVRAAAALAEAKENRGRFDPAVVFGDPNRAPMAFMVLLWALVVDIAAAHGDMPVLEVCARLTKEIDEVTGR